MKPLNQSNYKSLITGLALFIPFFGFFSPLFGVIYGLLLLMFLSVYIHSGIRYYSVFTIILLMALMFASRKYGSSVSDDFYYYYNSYISHAGSLEQVFEFGGGVEVGLGVILFLTHYIFPDFTPAGLIFIVTAIELSIYAIILERYVLVDINPELRSLSMSIFIIMSFGILAGQLSRQYGAIPMLIAAVLSKQKKEKLFFFLMACIFHISSILVFALLILFIWGSKSFWRFFSSITLIFLSLFLYENVDFLIIGSEYLSGKVSYTEIDEKSSFVLRNHIVLILISLFLMFFSAILGGDKNKRPTLYRAILFTTLVFIFMATYSNYSVLVYRCLLPVIVFFIWNAVVSLIPNNKYWVGLLVSLALFLFVSRSWLPVDADVGMTLWRQYESFSFVPGYFIYYLFL